MRPRLLKVCGFTSFREEQELDFTDLDIFAITGPTGAGKSSLLDAITYALYGRVERISNECSQLISHGLNRMSVTLDFEVDGQQYRITRATPAKGATRIGLERIEGGETRSFGEGADRVRECDKLIEQLIGLDYAGFTRSVLLPQGKFAEFMVGDPGKRREILSDLLGHGLFQRMSRTAGRRATECDTAADSRCGVLKSEYADATPEALEAARNSAQLAAARIERLDVAATEVGKLVDRWRLAQARAAELRSCAVDIRDWQRRVDTAVDTLGRLAADLEQHHTTLTEAAAAAEEAQRAAQLARDQRAKAESEWGTPVELAGAHTTGRRLPALRQQLVALELQLNEAAEREPRLVTELDTQRAAFEAAGDIVSEAEGGLAAAQQRLQDLEHADKAAALAEGLVVGDPCPVCGQPLEKLPEHPGASAISDAKRAVRTAQQALDGAQKTVRDFERQIAETSRDIQDAKREQRRLRDQLATVKDEFDGADRSVRTALRGLETEDPAAALHERIQQLEGSTEREPRSIAEAEAAARRLQGVEHAGELLLERLGQQRAVLCEPELVLLNRASSLGVAIVLPEVSESHAKARDLHVFGCERSRALATCGSTIESLAQQAAASEAALLQQAHVHAADLVEPAATLVAVADRILDARTHAAATRATATQEADSIAMRLEHRQTLESEIVQLRERAATYHQLATDLHGNKLIWFLQDEALQLLAAAGSEHLRGLSEGRYTLRYDREFFVVDTWNGDEERSVRTLSGGETFLASLSLALALSEQVRTLSVNERARLDSLFLDEGFGTLDPDTLAVVSEAIERLGGDGRMVGVITHVQELAENFPRIEVQKSPRGSRLRRVAA